jgi:parallel beta-helix repeat protein
MTKSSFSFRELAIPIIFSAGVLVSSEALGATRYVDNSGSPACSNSASSGSEAVPWCTITYAVNNINGGDDVYVKQGTYNEAPFISGLSGTPSKDTVIRAYPGHVVTIRGAGNTGRVRITAANYLTFDGFVVTNFNQGIFVDGGSTHVTIRNCTVHEVGQEGIHVRQNSSFITIEGCTVYDTERIGGCCNGEGIYVGTGSAGPLDNTNHVTVRNNTIHDTTDEGIELKPSTHDCLVEGNTLYRAGTGFTNANVGAIEVNERDLGVQTWPGNPSHVVRNNVVHDSATGIRLGTGATAYNNVIYSPISGRYGIYLNNANNDSFTRFVYHNTVHMTSNAVVVTSNATASIRNNIGLATPNNLAFSAAYFIDAAGANYHLANGAAAIDAGVDLTSVVATDKDGRSRPAGAAPDIGAYEFSAPSAPQNLRITVQ